MTPLKLDYPISVGILYFGGSSGDLQDTEEAVQGIAEALTAVGHMVRTQLVTSKNWLKAVRIPADVVFNLVEDPDWQLYTKVGMRLEWLGKAQVGHDYRSFLYATKKARIKRRLQREGIATPAFRILNRASSMTSVKSLEYPLMVKPSGEHAGIGISQDSVVIDQEELTTRFNYLKRHFPGEVIAEEFIDGREIHATVIGNGRNLAVLPFAEVNFGGEFADNWDVYTYEAKWEKKSWEYWDARVFAPVSLGKKIDAKIEMAAKHAFRTFSCRDIIRIDMRLKNDQPFIVDINMNPSLNRYDDQDATIKSVEALGWSYEEFIETLVAITYKRVYGRLPSRIRERHLLLSAPLRA